MSLRIDARSKRRGSSMKSTSRRSRSSISHSAFVPWLFLLPALALFVTFKIVPMAKGLDMSFYHVNFGSDWQWVGFDNFLRAFADEDLRAAAIHTAWYVSVSVVLSAALAFALALLLEGPARHLRIIRTAMFL